MKQSARMKEEASEKLSSIENDAPENKFQTKQQVAPSTGLKTNTGDSTFVLDKKKAPGSVLKQEIASTVVRDSALGGSNSGDGASFGGLRSSGSVGGVVGAANATPVVGKPDRSRSRVGKKLDRNSTKLNFIPCDQVLTEWDESHPLADAADQDQGFNGTYRNEFARSQKKAENVPGALMFDRSVDEISKDMIYFGQGQIINQSNVSYEDTPTKSAVQNQYGVFTNPVLENYSMPFGNYLASNLKFRFSHAGALIYFVFEEKNYLPNVDEHVANKSSAAHRIATNRGELWRESMDSKAGDEKADIWSCLPRAVAQPTATITFLEAIEADVGNEVLTGYRKFCTSMSYQLSRAHKDGQDEQAPAVDANTGMTHNYVSKAACTTGSGSTVQGLFTVANYCAGSAVTMIALYDSIGKYNTKADFQIQPRGYRMHLQTADNNMDPLYADQAFVQAYDSQEVFSTIDREFDPQAPVMVSDKAGVMHRISWNRMGAFTADKIDFEITGDSDATAADHALLPQEVLDIVIDNGLNMYIQYKNEASGSMSWSNGKVQATNTYEFNEKTVHVIFAATDPTAASGWSQIKVTKANIPTAGGLIINGKISVNTFIKSSLGTGYAYLHYTKGGTFRYCYSDLRNSYIIEVDHPLLAGLLDYLTYGVGIKYYDLVKSREVVIPTVHSTKYYSLWSLMLCAATPFIIKRRINSFRDILYYEKNVEYPFKDALVPLSEVKTKAYANFGFVDYDTELECKRMLPSTAITWQFPELYQQVGYASSKPAVLLPWYSNQNEVTALGDDDDASAMSFPSIRSGVRFGALDSLYGMTEKDVRLCLDRVSSWASIAATNLCAYKYSAVGDGQIVKLVSDITAAQLLTLPRELGYFMTAPYGVLTPTYNHVRSDATSAIGTTSYKATYWLAPGATTHTAGSNSQDILKNVSININRAANFKQDWFVVLASGTYPTVDHGFYLSANQALGSNGALQLGETVFKPYKNLDDTTPTLSEFLDLLSFQKIFWTRIQKLPFVISPFDGIVINNTSSPNSAKVIDPFEMMYWFGLGGFRASDYRESVYNREKQIVNQGLLFTKDPWVLESPVFKDGATTSGISRSTGFEL